MNLFGSRWILMLGVALVIDAEPEQMRGAGALGEGGDGGRHEHAVAAQPAHRREVVIRPGRLDGRDLRDKCELGSSERLPAGVPRQHERG